MGWCSERFWELEQQRDPLQGKPLPAEPPWVDGYERWVPPFPLVLWEDGCAPQEQEGAKRLPQKLGGRVHVDGEEVLVTDPKRWRIAWLPIDRWPPLRVRSKQKALADRSCDGKDNPLLRMQEIVGQGWPWGKTA